MKPEFFHVGSFDKAKVRAALSSYHQLNNAVSSLSLKELYGALRVERAGQNRQALVDRLIKRIRIVSLEHIDNHLHSL